MKPLGRRLTGMLLGGCLLAGALGGGVADAATQGSMVIDRVVRPNGGIGLVGDSLSYAYFAGLDDAFRAEAWGPIGLEVRSVRRTTVTQAIATSGLDAVRRLRANGFDAPVWIVALGTNDILSTFNTPGSAATLIDTMMSELGAGKRVVWVNVYAGNVDVKARAFNEALTAATSRHSQLVIADWYSLAADHPEWFVLSPPFTDDGVHINSAGAIARNQFVARAALASPCTAVARFVPPVGGLIRGSWAGGASALEPAQRLCRV